jgi:hypothetical protein
MTIASPSIDLALYTGLFGEEQQPLYAMRGDLCAALQQLYTTLLSKLMKL